MKNTKVMEAAASAAQKMKSLSETEIKALVNDLGSDDPEMVNMVSVGLAVIKEDNLLRNAIFVANSLTDTEGTQLDKLTDVIVLFVVAEGL